MMHKVAVKTVLERLGMLFNAVAALPQQRYVYAVEHAVAADTGP
jgi:hypothetical protein